MDAATREQAIKDATKNGTFQANQYAENLSAAQRRQAARNQAIAAKIERMEAKEGQRAQRPTVRPKSIVPSSGTHNFARRPKSAPARSAKPGLWSRFTSGVKNTIKKVVAPVVNVLQPKKNTGGGGKLAAPAKRDNDPLSLKDCGWNPLCWIGKGLEWGWQGLKRLFGKGNPPPATPTVTPTPHPIATPTLTPTVTPTFTPEVMQSILAKVCGTSSGTLVVGMKCEGTDPSQNHLTVWNNEIFPEFEIIPSVFPGKGDTGKAEQAKELLSKIGNLPHVAMIGYSSGAHVSLFVAEVRTYQGLPTDLILMGAPMHNPEYPILAYDLNGQPMTEEDYIKRVQALADAGVGNHILVIDEYAHLSFQEGFDGYNDNITYYPRPLAGDNAHQIIDDIPDVAKDAHTWLTNGYHLP